MFLSVILVLCCISTIESITCDISKEKSMISSMLQSIEKKTKECFSNGNCPAGWKKYKDHCYFISPDYKGWHDAAKQCNNMGGYLVKIENSAENSWVVSKLRILKSVKHGYWIGLADIKKEGDWRWVHDSSKVRYSHWYQGEPNDAGNNEDCALLWTVRQYQWNDAPCHLTNMGYICECSHGSNCRPFNG